MISKMVRNSDKAKMLFVNKIETLNKGRFGIDRVALHLGCRILAAFNLRMVQMYEDLVVRKARLSAELRKKWMVEVCFL